MRGRGLLVLGLVVLLVAAVGAVLTHEEPVRPATAVVAVDTDDRRQTWRGVGAALTDASVELLRDSPEGLDRLFGNGAGEAGLDWVRLPLTATDMSPGAWTWGWDGSTASPAPQAQEALALLADIRERQPDLRVVASPWTAPAWMKEPEGVRGGALRDDEIESYAAMLVAQADALLEAEVPLAAMTLGNEPGYGADYPSMTMTDDQQVRLGRLVGPELAERDVELWAVDHNWADRPSYDAVLGGAPDDFDAAAFHCYEGDPEQMAGVAAPPIITECTGTTASPEETLAWDARQLVARSTEAGSTGLLMWNLATDGEGGPRDPESTQGCQDCRGLLEVRDGRVGAGPELSVLEHLARAADQGSRVLGVRADPGIHAAAFANPDGTVGVFAHNDTGSTQVLGVRVGDQQVRRRVGAGDLVALRLSRTPS